MSSCASIFTPAKQTITFSGMEGTKIYDNGRKIATIDESGEATARIRKKLSSKELIAKKRVINQRRFYWKQDLILFLV